VTPNEIKFPSKDLNELRLSAGEIASKINLSL